MPKLDIKHLQMIEAISTAPTLLDAARRLSITASALSHRMREAERRLNVRLLARSAGRPQLTEGGLRILSIARRCLRELDVAEREAESLNQSAIEIVRVGASTLSGYQWLPAVLGALQRDHPRIEIEIVLDVSLDPLSALRERLIDIAIMPAAARAGALGSVRLFRDEMVALLPVSHPKAKRRWLNVEDLVDEVYIADGTTSETGREYERFFEPAGVRPRRVLRAGLTEAVVGLVRAGFGLTILSRWSAKPYLAARDLAVVPLTRRGLYLEWHAVLRREDLRASAARSVASVLQKSALKAM